MSTNTGNFEPSAEPKARRFRIFISYASEDLLIAEALRKCLILALGEVVAEINMDKQFLEPGIDFRAQIMSKLETTDVLIVVYTGVQKTSHGFTGWEVGFFDHIIRMSPGRTKVSLYLDKPPAISAEDQGISMALDIGPDRLRKSSAEFESEISVRSDDPMCSLLEKWQEAVDEISKANGLGVPRRTQEQAPANCVKILKIGIFQSLKTTIDTTLKPQKQITIRATGAALQQSLQQGSGDLPGEAEIIPVGSGGSMGIFSLPDVNTTWKQFLQSISESHYRDSWREAIAGVIMSSFPDHINVDNSQIIVSGDDKKTYRVILTTATKYYNDNREFNVYFVEGLQRPEYGDTDTTLLLKGLELVCRFRFMFLEEPSQFSAGNILANPPDLFQELVGRLLKELNLLRKDSRDVGLDDPTKWRRFVSWDVIQTMGKEYRPREDNIRLIIGRISEVKGKTDLVVPLQRELSNALGEMEEKVLPLNTLLLRQMAAKLRDLVPECAPRLEASG